MNITKALLRTLIVQILIVGAYASILKLFDMGEFALLILITYSFLFLLFLPVLASFLRFMASSEFFEQLNQEEKKIFAGAEEEDEKNFKYSFCVRHDHINGFTKNLDRLNINYRVQTHSKKFWYDIRFDSSAVADKARRLYGHYF
jgi:hypothetical protein